MTEITIRVPDDVARIIGELIEKIPDAEILRSVEDIKTEAICDECAKDAFEALLNDGTIKLKKDFAWIMLAINQHVIGDFSGFDSYQSFIDYLEYLNIKEKVPGKTTLFNADNLIVGVFPDWTFAKEKSPSEILRIKNVVKRFLNSYRTAKEGKLNNKLNRKNRD